MNKNEILKLLDKEENKKLEFKERFSNGVLKTISAFSNTSGGVVVVGVNNKGKIVGIDADDKNYQKIINKVIHKLGITPNFEIVEIDGRFVLVIEVDRSHIPVSFEGRYYKRVGNTTREMNFEELKRFFQKDLRWERLSERDFKIDEIDEHSVRSFLRTANAKGRLTVFNGNEPIKEVFERLGLMENGKINNAGLLLFGKNPQKYFDHARARVVRLKDDITIIGDRWIDGNLFVQFRETEETIKNFINVQYEIKGFEREDIWDYPLEAIREAIANALLHRDYLRPINVQIKVYDDKIWFYNVGGLPEEWNIEKLLSSHASMPRNPKIFYIFYLAGIVENVGSGIERMMQTLKNAGLPEPKIEANLNEFTLEFLKDIYTEEYLRKSGLNERQIKAVMYVKERGRITNREYQEINKTTKKTATRDLTGLVHLDIFEKIGTTGKGTSYILKRHNGDKEDI
ncbi:MAG: transcriptional regulator [Kosmotoga sp.]|jgi:ATP-dependent DNA helicase RecG|nr:MAG: transcriptional regulator [Kosmotoga sp.]